MKVFLLIFGALIIVQISNCQKINRQYEENLNQQQQQQQQQINKPRQIQNQLKYDDEYRQEFYANHTTVDRNTTIYFPYEDTNKNRFNTKVSGNFLINDKNSFLSRKVCYI